MSAVAAWAILFRTPTQVNARYFSLTYPIETSFPPTLLDDTKVAKPIANHVEELDLMGQS